jgi:hypothetical protein
MDDILNMAQDADMMDVPSEPESDEEFDEPVVESPAATKAVNATASPRTEPAPPVQPVEEENVDSMQQQEESTPPATYNFFQGWTMTKREENAFNFWTLAESDNDKLHKKACLSLLRGVTNPVAFQRMAKRILHLRQLQQETDSKLPAYFHAVINTLLENANGKLTHERAGRLTTEGTTLETGMTVIQNTIKYCDVDQWLQNAHRWRGYRLKVSMFLLAEGTKMPGSKNIIKLQVRDLTAQAFGIQPDTLPMKTFTDCIQDGKRIYLLCGGHLGLLYAWPEKQGHLGQVTIFRAWAFGFSVMRRALCIKTLCAIGTHIGQHVFENVPLNEKVEEVLNVEQWQDLSDEQVNALLLPLSGYKCTCAPGDLFEKTIQRPRKLTVQQKEALANIDQS